MTRIKDFIQAEIDAWGKLGVGYHSVLQQFVLRNGREFKPRKFDGDLMEPKQCFMNATKISGMDTPYVEGFVLGNDIPLLIHHAWVADDEWALDPTLKDPENFQYWGVEISQDELFSELARNEVYGVLDTGCGLNVDFMFATDPALKNIISC